MYGFSRFAKVETDLVDLETGIFPMVLATEGEADDGHIVCVRGARFDARSPLCINHDLDPTRQLGSIFDPTPDGDLLRATGQIEIGGDGPIADVRRDIAYMMAQGHIRAVSARGKPIKIIERSKLPRGHRAGIDPAKTRGPQRYGMYFEEWSLVEGSVVGRGSDPKALIGRSQETKGDVSSFWRSLVESQGDADESAIPLSIYLRACGENAELVARCDSLEERVRALTDTPRQTSTAVSASLERRLAEELAAYESRLDERLTQWAEKTLGRILR